MLKAEVTFRVTFNVISLQRSDVGLLELHIYLQQAERWCYKVKWKKDTEGCFCSILTNINLQETQQSILPRSLMLTTSSSRIQASPMQAGQQMICHMLTNTCESGDPLKHL